jgi:phosphatidylglycerol---prolipoprotein diacylglyceryl transferase
LVTRRSEGVSFPYLSDLVRFGLGVNVPLPIPMFGFFVALAVALAGYTFSINVRRTEGLDRLPAGSHRVVSDLAAITLVAGIVGARVFDILDHLPQFTADPASLIFSRRGFSIYGGLVFGFIAGMCYLRRRGIPILPMLDSIAPALLLAYAVGRMGCQVSGDGDWGIAANLALKPEWLPRWLWAQTYQGNIVGEGIPLPGVYPTPIYESVAALVMFLMLQPWASRARPLGSIFALYLLCAGFERLLVEKIRINPRLHFLGLAFTQAELISVCLIVVGIGMSVIVLPRKRRWVRLGIPLALVALLSACVAI